MSNIILDIEHHCAIITLNNAAKHNALHQTDIALFIAHLNSLASQSDIRSLIITGTGNKTFCAGASFEHIKDGSLTGEAFSKLAASIQNLNIPSICLLNGSVFGGGVELALACDFRIGISGTYLQVPVARLGLCYSAFGLKLYQQKLGPQLSKRILLSAEKISAQTLLDNHFYDFLADTQTQALAKAKALAADINQLAPLAVQAMRKSLDEISCKQLDADGAQQREQMCLNSQDKQEGFTALLEKRKPVFNKN